jgi:hypothetical protein
MQIIYTIVEVGNLRQLHSFENHPLNTASILQRLISKLRLNLKNKQIDNSEVYSYWSYLKNWILERKLEISWKR